MKIVAVNSVREFGGGEKWLLRQGALWQAAGHSLTVVGRAGAALADHATASGIEFRPAPMRHDLSLPSVAGLARVVRAARPDVLLCCTERAFRLTAAGALLSPKPPLVCRNGLTGTFKNKQINRLLYRRTAAMVVNAPALREELAAFGWIPPERLHVISNGIDCALYDEDVSSRSAVRSEMGASADAVVVAMIGRLTDDKGQREAVRAFKALVAEFPGAELWLIGEGSLRAELVRLIEAEGLAERVRVLGFRADVPRLLQAIDIVLQASKREGMANTILEAMAARKAVIATRVGGAEEQIEPDVSGILIPAEDPEALIRSLQLLLGDRARRESLGESARKRVEARFSLAEETAAWLRLFERVTSP